MPFIATIRGDKELITKFGTISTRLPKKVGETMSSVSNDMASLARSNLRIALAESRGSTGALVNAIKTRRVARTETTQQWLVIVSGAPGQYADEIESKFGLPREKQITRKLQNWIDRIRESGDFVYTKDNQILVGFGTHPKSIYTRYPNGVRYMQRAYNARIQRLHSDINNAVRQSVK